MKPQSFRQFRNPDLHGDPFTASAEAIAEGNVPSLAECSPSWSLDFAGGIGFRCRLEGRLS